MHAFYFREAWRSFRHHRGLGITAIVSIAAALTLSGMLLLLANNTCLALQLIGDRREMVVYLRDEVTAPQREDLMARMRELYGTVTYVSKDEAWHEFSDQVGDPALLEAVGANPLPASLRIKMRPELLSASAMQTAADQVKQYPEVEDVRYGGDWVRRLENLQSGLVRAALALGVVVALAVVFVLYNTIRLTVLARRPQVEIMSRLGASDRFVATPFVIEAIFVASAASLIALGLLYAAQQAVATRLLGISFLPWTWTVAFFGATVALAWLAAQLALARVLRAVGP